MRLVFAGTPEVAIPSLEAVAASRHELVAVVSRPDAPLGRSKRPVPSPVAQWALDHGVELLRPSRVAEPDFVDRLVALAPDCCPVVAYGALIPPRVLAIPRHGWVNVHFSLLPAYRGAAPVQRAILAGDSVTGVTIFDLVPELDAGPIYRQDAVNLGPDETSGEVLARLAVSGAATLVEVLDDLDAGIARAIAQPTQGVSHAPKLTVADGQLDWDRPAIELDRRIRACNPSPMSWTTLAGERFRVLLARPATSANLPPGQVSAGRREVVVGTGAGDLELLTVQPAGRRSMAAADWGRGLGGATPVLGR